MVKPRNIKEEIEAKKQELMAAGVSEFLADIQAAGAVYKLHDTRKQIEAAMATSCVDQ